MPFADCRLHIANATRLQAEIWPVNARAKGNAMGVVGWSIGNGWCTLLVPVMFDKIKEVSPGFPAFSAVVFAVRMLTRFCLRLIECTLHLRHC